MPREVVRKARLDGQVAELLGKKTREVSLITRAFLNEVVKELIRTGTVRLDGLGRLQVNVRRGARASAFDATNISGEKVTRIVRAKYYVTFKRAAPLRKALVAHYSIPASRKKESTHGKARSRRGSGPGVPGKSSR